MVDDYMLDKALNKVKMITCIEKFDDTKILIEQDYKLPDDVTLQNVVTLITCVIEDCDKFSPQVFLEEELVA